MLPQEIAFEQAHLQQLWNRVGATGHIAYASRVGWWVVFTNTDETADVWFLGRYIQDAQQYISVSVKDMGRHRL
jgi:hypothetical protein